MLNTHSLDMILQVKYMPIVMNPAKILEMLWSELRLILKTSSVTPDFFYVFYRILSFSTVSQSFKQNLCVGSFWARTSLNPRWRVLDDAQERHEVKLNALVEEYKRNEVRKM